MTIVKRGEKFGVAVKDPTHPKGQRWVGTFDTREQAVEEEILAKRAVRLAQPADEPAPGDAITVAQYRDRYLEKHCAHVADNTLYGYQYQTGVFCRTHGDRLLSSIDAPEARDWSKSAQPGTRAAVRAMFTKAVEDEYLKVNPFIGVRVAAEKKVGRGGENLVILTHEQLDTLASTAERLYPGPFGGMFGALITIAAYTGMRPGELFALEWDDIDTAKHRVHVRQSRSFRSGKLKTPKNGLERTIVFPPQAVAALAKCPRLEGSPRVFNSRRGLMLSPSTFGHQWAPVRAASGTPIEVLYELRHFCATVLRNAGCEDFQVAYQLGHTDGGKLVREIYFHPNAEDTMGAVLDGFAKIAA